MRFTISAATLQVFFASFAVLPHAVWCQVLDVGFIVDVSGSFNDDIASFKTQAAEMTASLTAAYPQVQFGLATFQDFPLGDWGSPSDVPHRLVRDLGPADDEFMTAVNSLSATGGADIPESQLTCLYQCITGEGLVVPASLDGGYTIPPNMGFSWRDRSSRILLLWTDAVFHTPDTTTNYPGPTFDEVITAANDLNAVIEETRRLQDIESSSVRITGIQSPGAASSSVQMELQALATGTGAVAGEGGLDCDGDGTPDIMEGEGIVCPVVNLDSISSVIVSVVNETVRVISTSAPTSAPTSVPTSVPTSAPTEEECPRCGIPGIVLFGVQIWCPRTRCGLFAKFIRSLLESD
eukprot:CAMPEP_0118715738 /NCGR_PEP_ID=MMETSP0800-20121206/27068_1 /TAXON_ID=210618 ORGANISM="Striatella unipunctata, Strain CCMP2910" /NCGR_SAMPLE_ID=MMETSP0800 /ASSEMBLY_ACC=CAM_ASM_000638 /LENGTH=350 /DNA_ID=CAMNT_0006621993 /DNA_START=20 /DNA_END=1072 /DNA_ORIENTATION=+